MIYKLLKGSNDFDIEIDNFLSCFLDELNFEFFRIDAFIIANYTVFLFSFLLNVQNRILNKLFKIYLIWRSLNL